MRTHLSTAPARPPAAFSVVLDRPDAAACVRYVEVSPARAGATVPLPAWLPHPLVVALAREGITELWQHQAEAVTQVRAGQHVVVATGTASGKSLTYLLPAATDALAAPAGTTGVPSTLYLAPTKSLAADQLRKVSSWEVPGLRPATLDGDTPLAERDWVREHAGFVLSNPDMLSRSVLPQHERWSRFLRRLAYVVLDECHVYRGVFGAHVAAVLRRLLRLAEVHGASPTVVCCSATVAEPESFAGRLTGLDVVPVTADAAPDAGGRVVLWDPAGAAEAGQSPARRGLPGECAGLVADLAGAGVRTLAFTGSRRGTETLARATRELLRARDDPAAERVAAYRGGHLATERRAVERALRSGELLAVCATAALELGVDIAGLDAVVLAGWPGSVASLRQRAGRSGRAGSEGLAVLVAGDDPVDSYVFAHAERVLTEPMEAAVTDPDNPYVLAPHLACAAAEHPLSETDLKRFGPSAPAVVDQLAADGDLRRRPGGWYWARGRRPAVELRGGGQLVQLVEEGTGRVLGTVDEDRAELVAHPGAVYQHRFETYLVTALDLEGSVALLVAEDPGYVTVARTVTAVRLVEREREQRLGDSLLGTGAVEVRRQTVGYVRRDPVRGVVLAEETLELPERSFRTRGTWWCPEPLAEDGEALGRQRLAGGLHAAEHAAVAILPLVALSDRHDVAGSSSVRHPDLGGPAVLVHDARPGGAGFAERAFDAGPHWLGAAHGAVATCPCRTGCPACVIQVGCGSGNQPLDKGAAARLLALAVR